MHVVSGRAPTRPISLIAVLALVVGACSSGTTASTAPGSAPASQAPAASAPASQAPAASAATGAKGTVVLAEINLTALFFTQMVPGAQKAADDAGVKLVVLNGNNDQTTMNNQIESVIPQKPLGIIADAIDVNGIKPALQQAAAAGIPVVAVDAIISDPSVKVQVGVDNGAAAQQLGQYFVSWAQQNNFAKDSAVGVVGALNSFIQVQRQDAFTNALKGAGYTIGQVVDGQNVQDTAQTAAETLFTANPTMQAVYATGEPALIGAIAAARSQSVTNKIHIFGWDLSPDAVKGIQDGFVQAVVQQDPYTEGVDSVQSVIKLSQGQSVPANIQVPVSIVTKDNVAQFESKVY